MSGASLRVVHVVAAGEVGGAERMLVDLARGPLETADGRPVAPSVLLFAPDGRLATLFRDHGLEVEEAPRRPEGPLADLARNLGDAATGAVARAVFRRGARLVHLHTYASHLPGARGARAAGVPFVRTEHSTRVFDDPTCWPFSRWSLERAAWSVSVSAHVRGRLLERAAWLAPRTSVVPNGIDLATFVPAPLPSPGDDGLHLLALGRLDVRKGLDRVVEALAEVPGVVLDVVGDGAERAALARLADESGVAARVRFHGHQHDVRPFVARAHALVTAARAEGLGLALLEGMAMGRPVVGLATGGVPEVVGPVDDPARAAGWLGSDASPRALGALLREALADVPTLRRRGERARARVTTQFSLDAMRAAYAALYADVAPPRPGA